MPRNPNLEAINRKIHPIKDAGKSSESFGQVCRLCQSKALNRSHVFYTRTPAKTGNDFTSHI